MSYLLTFALENKSIWAGLLKSFINHFITIVHRHAGIRHLTNYRGNFQRPGQSGRPIFSHAPKFAFHKYAMPEFWVCLNCSAILFRNRNYFSPGP